MKRRKSMAALIAGALMAVTVIGTPLGVAAAGEDITTSVSDGSAAVGETVTIDLSFAGDDIWGSERCTLDYDKEVLELESLKATSLSGFFDYNSTTGYFSFANGSEIGSGTLTATFEVLKCTPDLETDVTANFTFLVETDGVRSKVPVSSTGTVAIKGHGALATDEKAATCTEDGYKKVTCTMCDTVISNDTYNALNHIDGEWEVTKDPTCVDDGTKVLHCDRCGEVIDTDTIPTTGVHDYKWEVTQEATCTKEGEETGSCEVCGDVTTRSIPKIAHTPDEDSWEVTEEATCTEAGKRTGKCSVCGQDVTEVIEAKGHDWKVDENTDKDGWMVTKEATATEEGSKERVCSVCGEKETKVIPKLGSETTTPTVTPGGSTTGGANTNTGTNTNTGSVATGDPFMAGIYVAIAVVAAGGITAIVVTRKRRANR